MSPRRLSGKGWSVGVVEDLEVAAGERVRFTGTNSDAGYRNREHGVVGEISADALTIRRSDGSNLKLGRDRVLSLDYSYAVTGHSAQGLDASRVILEKDTHSRTTDRRSFYTDVTRARDTAVVVTDSSARLAQIVHSDRTALQPWTWWGRRDLLASGHENQQGVSGGRYRCGRLLWAIWKHIRSNDFSVFWRDNFISRHIKYLFKQHVKVYLAKYTSIVPNKVTHAQASH